MVSWGIELPQDISGFKPAMNKFSMATRTPSFSGFRNSMVLFLIMPYVTGS